MSGNDEIIGAGGAPIDNTVIDDGNGDKSQGVVIKDGKEYNYLEILTQMSLFNSLYMPVLAVTSVNNNVIDERVEFWHDGFSQYYISYDSIRTGTFLIVENNILKVSTCTALALENGDFLELE